MNKAFAIVALVGAATVASADLHTFDLSGMSVEGSFGDNFGVTSLMHDFGAAGTVVNVSWDVNYESFDPSWMSEVQMAVDTNDDLSLDGDIDALDYGATDNPGVFSFSGSIAASSVSSDGLVYLTVYDLFNDASATPDAKFGAGSSLTVEYIVPAPGSMALLGLGGLVAARRRRA